MQQAAPVRLFGKRGCPAAYAIRDFLHRSDIPFEWIELRDDEHARKELGIENVDDSRLPICGPTGRPHPSRISFSVQNGYQRIEAKTILSSVWTGPAGPRAGLVAEAATTP